MLFDLKTDELTHQDIGQMDMYVRMYDQLRRGPEDNPTVGVILCARKDETVVRYSILSEHKRLFASRYKMVLPSEKELRAELMREQRLLEKAGTCEHAGTLTQPLIQGERAKKPDGKRSRNA